MSLASPPNSPEQQENQRQDGHFSDEAILDAIVQQTPGLRGDILIQQPEDYVRISYGYRHKQVLAERSHQSTEKLTAGLGKFISRVIR